VIYHSPTHLRRLVRLSVYAFPLPPGAGAMLILLLFLELSFLFLSNHVAALNITVQSNTVVGQPSLVMWARVPSDGDGRLVFDLRFVKPDNEDKGLALANIQAPPSTKFGTAQVVFMSPGSYRLVAVSGPSYTWIGQSDQVNAYQVPTTSMPTSTSQPVPSMPTSTSQPVPSATRSGKSTSTSSGARPKKNLGAIIGGTLGGVAFLGLVAALGIVFLRRRQPEPTKENTRRWTFNRDKMILPPVLDIRRTSPMNTDFDFFSPGDIEQQQQGFFHDDIVPTSPVVMMASPSGSRPLLKSPHRSIPLPPLLLKPHQEDIVAQMEQIRNKMTELEKNPGPTQHIILDDLQKQMNWFKSQL